MSPALALTVCAGLVATAGLTTASVLATSTPSAAAEADSTEPELLRAWTGAKKGAVGTGLTPESSDFTGDGKDDIIASAWLWKRAPFGEIGAVYVIPNGTDSGQLDDPTTGITRIEGPQKTDISVGFRASCGGDVNGDGFDDLLIDEGESSRVWVVYGSATPENISLEFLGDRGFIIDRDIDVDAGYDTQLAAVGDLDGERLR
ncbi:FG-GAP repeat protein [Leucobacter sp. cx-42]|uniref:FG-GAP repeat protein n=1 Tax=unclassified Leucobacter TaxID=2621730 RepID=UPI00165DBF1F|nr:MULTISPECIES: FG-GAP repeat protein [unclassified Leucobacter]MBC9953210.1 FG-GAP repeat protein [Leucobacter sp. cx-42]